MSELIASFLQHVPSDGYQLKVLAPFHLDSPSTVGGAEALCWPGDVIAPAKILLTRVINQRLSEHCSPAILFKGINYQESHLYYRSNNLLGVIWLQFARSVANNTAQSIVITKGVS